MFQGSPGERTVDLSETRKVQTHGRRSRGPAAVPALTILCHPEVGRIGDRLLLNELLRGRQDLLSRQHPEFTAPGQLSGQPLADLYLSREPLRFSATKGGVRLEFDPGRAPVSAQGTPLQGIGDFSQAELARGVVLELSQRVVLLLHWFTVRSDQGQAAGPRLGMAGDSAAVQQLRNDIRGVADLQVPVLLRGETGTGKELAAQAIHSNSPRRDGPFITVNLGSITPSLAVAELFGAARGAYTGAVRDQQGYFQRAHGGTIFLDEVGEAPSEVQVMLLRVLETGEIQPLGKQAPCKVDVRVVAATDSDLESRARCGEFREPLIHRLSGYVIWLPPLRHRRDDIGRLLLHFLGQELERVDESHRLKGSPNSSRPWLPASLVARLAGHDWPGNIRQLRNVARQLVIGSRGLDALQISPPVQRLLQESAKGQPRASQEPAAPKPVPKPRRKPSQVSQAELVAALSANRWDLKATAAQLQISRPSLYRLIESCPQTRLAEQLQADEIKACYRECQGDLEAMVDKLKVSKAALRRRMRAMGLNPGKSKSDNQQRARGDR